MRRVCGLLLCALLFSSGVFLPASGAEALKKPADAFENTVFVGDSILQQLDRYQLACRQRGKPLLKGAAFMTAAGCTAGGEPLMRKGLSRRGPARTRRML